LGSGLIGVILGLITTIIIAKVTEWQFLFAPSALFNSLIFSTVVAVLASQYPASIIKKMPVAYILKGE
jgi:ABC-type antimicrobial peptide transport system permease subunit